VLAQNKPGEWGSTQNVKLLEVSGPKCGNNWEKKLMDLKETVVTKTSNTCTET
jgi:hypothetical protein